MVEEWINEIKTKVKKDELGMILIHNGIVRSTSKDGNQISGIRFSYDREKLAHYVEIMKNQEGIAEIKVWLNEGRLNVGDDIMYLLVAGKFRTDVLPVFQRLITIIKNEVVTEEEISL